MPTLIQPNHMSVTDSRPSLSYRIRPDHQGPVWIEFMLATEPALAVSKSNRSASNFFSSRGYGARLPVQNRNGVFVVPAVIMRQFIGQRRLYHGVAVYLAEVGGTPVELITPHAQSAYVDISQLTGRTLNTTIGSPNRQGGLVNYGEADGAAAFLAWAGDDAIEGAAAPVIDDDMSKSDSRRKGGYQDGFEDATGVRLDQDSKGSAKTVVDDPSIPQQLGTDMYVQSQGASGVDVKLRVFIPSPAIGMDVPILPLRAFGGDGRGFSYSGGTSRAEIHANVQLTGAGAISIINRDWGESLEYNSADTYQVQGKPDWFRGINDGASPIAQETLGLTDDNLSIRFGGHSTRSNIEGSIGDARAISFHVEGQLPLVTPSPDIDANLTVFLREVDGSIHARVYGSHDGFPAYELYVNQQLIYSYDPVAAGNGPTSLVGTSDQTVDSSYTDTGTLTVAQAYGAPNIPGPGQAYNFAASSAPARSFVWAAIAGAVGPVILEALINNEGDVHWEVQRMPGWKNVHDDTGNKGSASNERDNDFLLRGPKLKALGIDEIFANFRVKFRYDGRSVGHVQISEHPEQMSDAIGLGLQVKTQIRDVPEGFPTTAGPSMAAVDIAFHYWFKQDIGNDSFYVRTARVFGDGSWQAPKGEWTQEGTLVFAA